MDVRDCTKHPFRIECPAELWNEDPDQWLFSFNNGVMVWCADAGDGYWTLMALGPGEYKIHELESPMTDNDSAITNFLDRVARLENP